MDPCSACIFVGAPPPPEVLPSEEVVLVMERVRCCAGGWLPCCCSDSWLGGCGVFVCCCWCCCCCCCTCCCLRPAFTESVGDGDCTLRRCCCFLKMRRAPPAEFTWNLAIRQSTAVWRNKVCGGCGCGGNSKQQDKVNQSKHSKLKFDTRKYKLLQTFFLWVFRVFFCRV